MSFTIKNGKAPHAEAVTVSFTAVLSSGKQYPGYDAEGACPMPCAYYVVPPHGAAPGSVAQLTASIQADNGATYAASLPPFDWPVGEHRSAVYWLGGAP